MPFKALVNIGLSCTTIVHVLFTLKNILDSSKLLYSEQQERYGYPYDGTLRNRAEIP